MLRGPSGSSGPKCKQKNWNIWDSGILEKSPKQSGRTLPTLLKLSRTFRNVAETLGRFFGITLGDILHSGSKGPRDFREGWGGGFAPTLRQSGLVPKGFARWLCHAGDRSIEGYCNCGISKLARVYQLWLRGICELFVSVKFSLETRTHLFHVFLIRARGSKTQKTSVTCASVCMLVMSCPDGMLPYVGFQKLQPVPAFLCSWAFTV